MSISASVENLYQAIRALPVSDRMRLIERLAHQAAEEFAGAPSAHSASPARGRGFDSGRARIADDFDAPLPDDIQAAFEGQDHDR